MPAHRKGQLLYDANMIDAPGPNGRSNWYQMNSSTSQNIQNTTVNTIRRDIRVPMPAFGS